ncbi:MAG: Rpn family recombination-promoting nuclease/putative transposase [Polyangiaceae bacterium]|nr:Rpn family recombination-promoting nuclease/putative transposase [Polyangiaceae bacterium]
MPSNVHDLLFRGTFSQPEHAASILRLLLPPALVARLDWSTLAHCPGSFVDEALSERFTDLLFSVVFGGRPSLLYLLFEHQSQSEPFMAMRLLRYEVRIWEAWLKDHPAAKRVPAILPVVLHHSPKGWTAEVSFEALLDIEPELFETLAPYVPRFRFILDDISAASDEALRGRAMSALGRLVLWCLRNARTPENLVWGLKGWVDLVREVRRAPNGAAALQMIFRYIYMVNERFDTKELVGLLEQAVGEEGKAEMTSVADKLREEGRLEGERKGLLRGQRNILLKQLRARFGELPEATVARVNAAELGQLDTWAERVLSAQTLADAIGSD